jgi:hypothetical protein
MEYKTFNPADKITLDVPLFIRLLEYAREDAKTDMDLHKVTENAVALSETGKTLTMDQYDAIVKDGGQEDASYANMANENKKTVNESKNMKTQLNELKRMQQLAGLINEGEYQESTIGKESDAIIPKSLVIKYANMKSLFGDKAKNTSVISKLIPIVTDFFPKNLDISYQELEDNFDEETANQVVTVLFGAYIDGYLDNLREPITRLFRERDTKHPD